MAACDFLIKVEDELERARRLHPTNINNVAEGFAVIKEEVDEFWDEVKKKQRDRDPANLLEELIQIAAMAARTAEDCKLL